MAYKYKVQAGETLNAIANKFGFANYKEAGVSAVPSGDFDAIRPGEEITLGNYDPNNVKTISTTPPVISSSDVEGEYKSKSSSLDEKLLQNNRAYTLNDGSTVYFSGEVTDAEMAARQGKTLPTGSSTPGTEGKPKTGSAEEVAAQDPLYAAMLKSEETGKASAQVWADEQTKKINALLPKTLSLLDAQYANSVSNITNTYTKLIDEQKIINRRSIDRTKAYGLEHGAQYMPLEFTEAVSEKETKAAGEIAKLENDRNDLLAKAKAARDSGEIDALRENMTALDSVEEKMRTRTKDLADEVQKRYELVVSARKEVETKHKEAVQKMLAAASAKYLTDFTGAKDEKAKDKLVREIIMNSGGVLTDADYYTVYSALAAAATTKEKTALDTAKTKAEIASTEALTRSRNADAAKTYAEAAVKSEEKKTINSMKAEIDAISFKTKDDGSVDDTDAEAKRQAFVKKYGETGKKYWDDVFKDDTDLYSYQPGGGNNEQSTALTALGATPEEANQISADVAKYGIEEVIKQLGADANTAAKLREIFK